jgi:polyisoprenoid-binding protein YceI
MSSFQLDKSHSSIDFTARHMMISKVRGRFDSFDGTFALDEQNPANSRVNVTIDAASISTRDAQRDAHLLSPDFLNVEAFPTLSFAGSRVEQLSDNTAKLYGDLTIRDVTNPVVIDVTFLGTSLSPWGQTAYGFEGSTRISRKAWGLTWNVALETGGVLVGDEIDISIALELVKVAETETEGVAAA